MTIHFKADDDQLQTPGSSHPKGVRAMNLREGDTIISMDILPAQVTAAVAASELEDVEEAEALSPTEGDQGPWVLVITATGLGKRVPVTNFRLQNRAGLGLVGMKFRKEKDELVALRVVGPNDELMLVTHRGIIIRQAICAISVQSRMATGVQLQRLDGDDAIAAVAIVPQAEAELETATDAEMTEMDPPTSGAPGVDISSELASEPVTIESAVLTDSLEEVIDTPEDEADL
jgi:DNA gyrase subunit A